MNIEIKISKKPVDYKKAVTFMEKRLDKIIEAIDTLNPFEEKRDIFSTSILANSYQLNFDHLYKHE